MKKIISIILGIMLMLSMSVTSFAAIAAKPDPEVIEFAVTCVDATPATDSFGNPSHDMIYTFSTKVTNKTKQDIPLDAFNVALIFINDKTYETIDAANFTLNDTEIDEAYNLYAVDKEWSAADEAIVSKTVTNQIRMSYDKATTVDIKVLVNGEVADDNTDMIRSTNDGGVKISIDMTPKSTPDAPTTETTTDAPTEAPTQAPTEAPTESKPADTTTTTRPADTTTEKAPADVDYEIPDTGATVPFAAIGTLVTSAITALVAKKKKEN